MLESEEYLDILDNEGNFTNTVKTRELAHRLGLWHRTVHIWVVNDDGQVLLQLRAPTVHSDPNRWDISSAGHIPAGESSRSGAVRELQEELGIYTQEDKLVFLFVNKHEIICENICDRAFNDIYLLQANINIDELTLQKEEVAAVKWLPWQELLTLAKQPDVVDHTYEYNCLYKILEKTYK